MGKNNRAKKKKGLTIDEKLIRREVNRADARREALWHEHIDGALEAIAPIFEESTFVQLMYFALTTAHDKFGFGKKRLTELATGILNQYERLNKEYVTVADMVEEIYRITGERYVLTETEIYDRWRQGCIPFGVVLETTKELNKERY